MPLIKAKYRFIIISAEFESKKSKKIVSIANEVKMLLFKISVLTSDLSLCI
ncbi:protein of unknown function [Clostridium beijerinckii]|nr:protein of unknown function [Clostridium beijerinckii]